MKLSYLLGTVAVLAIAGGGYVAYQHYGNTGQPDTTITDTIKSPPAPSDTLVSSEKNPVVAKVGDEEIRQSDVLALMAKMNTKNAPPPQALLPMILDRMINTKLIYDAATTQGLATDPLVQQRLEDLKKQVIIEMYAEKAMEKKLTPEALKSRYNKFLKDNPPQEEVRARHILVKTEEEAKTLIQQIQDGADFSTLAKDKSVDPSAQQNAGDLGYFTKDIMVEPFAKAAFAEKPGKLIEKPVQTQFGWHVIKVEDKRKSTPPSFEQVEPELRNQVAQETLSTIIADLSKKAKVQRFNWDGSVIAETSDKKKD